ncbi:MAG: aminotransferase class I/II-fold pyridoxal phosphate-dependent enzyme [Gemmatimonadetes bacterium]|nr:aminotransferase class I/II-fold pyridoxal phosphate-dependent enzyme [Gemmatimonadota bacterium]NNM06637.1 aminotransferase class I/II-fold pyridoxal phosphate-dependent enzyme [Gemmatimonadota bacterium]
MANERMDGAWTPYVAWMKHAPAIPNNLMGSNLLPCTVEDLPGVRERLELDAFHEEGYPPLLEAIGKRYQFPVDRIALATGASGANFIAGGALLEAGDEVLVERPVYDPLLGIPRFLGARIRRFDRVFDDGFQVDPDRVAAALTPKTRLIILTNLHNPTGARTSAERLLAVGELADGVGAKVLVDEVYLDSVGGDPSPPAASLSPTFVSTSSLTKAYGLSGLRAGWILAAPEVAEGCRRVRDLVDGVGVFPSELMALVAFENLPALRARARGILDPNFELLTRFVESRPDLLWVRPRGGSVGFPKIPGLEDVSAFVEILRTDYETGVVPGRFFEAPSHFRIALGGKRDVLETGLHRLGEALDKELTG